MAGPLTFSYRGSHDLPLGRSETWTTLERADLYESWWQWMRRLEIAGTPLETGTTFTFVVVAPIPFTMNLAVRIEESVPPERIRARITGDLEGSASMTFEEISSELTCAKLEWTVEVKKPGMRTAARALRPLLQWGQSWAVDVALRGFLRHLGED
ncbi:MAG TPA: hypothetical protein VEV82_02510 [Actinomycetota bacterium]|nr:hypothetical protein [Actinomycetota bacterium]